MLKLSLPPIYQAIPPSSSDRSLPWEPTGGESPYLLDFRTAGTFTRTTEASYLAEPPNSTGGFMKWAAPNERRINVYTPDGSTRGHFLGEGPVQQLIPTSQVLDLSAWGLVGGATVTVDQGRAPDDTIGSTNADRVQTGASAGDFAQTSLISLAANTTYTFHVWARAFTGTSQYKITILDADLNETVQIGTIDTTWTLISVTHTTGPTAGGGRCRFRGATGITQDLLVRYPNLHQGYFPNSTVRSATTSGGDTLNVRLPRRMLTGSWKFDFIPFHANNEPPSGALEEIYKNTRNDILRWRPVPLSFQLLENNTNIVSAGTIGFNRYQKITLKLNAHTGTIEVSGANSGNGTYGTTPWSWVDSNYSILYQSTGITQAVILNNPEAV